MATTKKVVRVGSSGGGDAPQRTTKFTPTAEAKSKATKLRIFAVICWVIAIAAEIGAIYILLNQVQPVQEIKAVAAVQAVDGDAAAVDSEEAPAGALTAKEQSQKRSSSFMTCMIILIVIDMLFVILGSVLFWKKANRLDPASEKDKVRFFLQNQLGVIVAIIAFLPLIILILTNKDLDDKQKGILGVVAGVALLAAGYFGIDFNPPSIEKYTAEIEAMEQLTGANEVFWTKSGSKYHIYQQCGSINSERTDTVFAGPLQYAYEQNTAIKPGEGLCGHCRNKRVKEQANEQLALPDAS